MEATQTAPVTQVQVQVQVKVPQLDQVVVSRQLGFREVAGGKFRRGIIYYEYNRQTKTLKYGASIFQTTSKHPEHYDSAGHHRTAKNRLEQHPVVVENFPDNTTLVDFQFRLRKLLFTHGCRSKA